MNIVYSKPVSTQCDILVSLLLETFRIQKVEPYFQNWKPDFSKTTIEKPSSHSHNSDYANLHYPIMEFCIVNSSKGKIIAIKSTLGVVCVPIQCNMCRSIRLYVRLLNLFSITYIHIHTYDENECFYKSIHLLPRKTRY